MLMAITWLFLVWGSSVSSQWALLLFYNILYFNSVLVGRRDIGNNQIYETSYQYLPSCLVMGHSL